MKKTLSFYDFCDEWEKWEDRKNTFSYEGKKALFEYLEEYEESTGEEIELDIIALCCDYTEYESFEEFKADYSNIKTLGELQDRTQYIPIYNNDGTESERFIIQNF